ncbi:hypothetical protein FQN54_007895 [Arachnomyces sp. PD_36]|nr:hypothetical protein FQN54_007895 [Arachnomyces sp. PD_36]
MASPDFDPLHQNVRFRYSDGTPFNVTVDEINGFYEYNTNVSINFGAQLGASIVLVIILAIMTKPERRRSAMYALNVAALLFNIVRLTCMCVYFTSGFADVYRYFALDYEGVPPASYANSAIVPIVTVLLLISLEISLVVQAHVICSTSRPWVRRCVLVASLLAASAAVGLRIGYAVENVRFILAAEDFSPMVWLQSATNIAITCSICYFSAVFMVKLGLAIRQRRQLGFKKFGPMQVIFVMGSQTMFIPAACSISLYFTEVLELGSNILTLVAIFLPLTSMWAAAVLENNNDLNSRSGRFWMGTSCNSNVSRQTSTSTCSQCTATALGPHGPSKILSASDIDRHSSLYPDLESGDFDDNIHVDRNFSVASCRQGL